MSHDQGIASARQTMHGPQGKPSLDRPSLFAGQDTGHSDADETQRVRILSALESSRRPNLPPSRRGKPSQGMGWMPKALIGLMALGSISLLVGFVMVIQQGHPAAAQAPESLPAQGKEAALHLPHAAASAPGTLQVMAPATVAVPASAAHNPLEALSATATVVDDRDAVAPEPPPVSKTPTSEAAPTPKTQRAAKDNNAEAPTAKVDRKQTTNAKHDEDVALLEAMFTHAGPRKAPVSAAEDIRKRCGGMTGSEASSCRVKVCAQHPKSPLCRD